MLTCLGVVEQAAFYGEERLKSLDDTQFKIHFDFLKFKLGFSIDIMDFHFMFEE